MVTGTMVAVTSLVPLLLGVCTLGAVIADSPAVGPTPPLTGAERFIFGPFKGQLMSHVQHHHPDYTRKLIANPFFHKDFPKHFAALKQLQPAPPSAGIGSPVSPAGGEGKFFVKQQPPPPSIEIGSPISMDEGHSPAQERTFCEQLEQLAAPSGGIGSHVSPASADVESLRFPIMGRYPGRLVSDIQQQFPGYASNLLRSHNTKLFRDYPDFCKKLRSFLDFLPRTQSPGSPTQRNLFNMGEWSLASPKKPPHAETPPSGGTLNPTVNRKP